MEDMATATSGRLDGWKQIAAYLRHDIRTVQRWEQKEGLPVHRHDGVKPRVWAFTSELDRWWLAREQTPARGEPPEGASESDPREPPPVLLVPSRSAAVGMGSRFSLRVICALILGGSLTWLVFSWNHAYSIRDTRQQAEVVFPDRIFAAAESEHGMVRVMHVGGHPASLRLSPDARELYVVDNGGLPRIQVVDAEHMTLTRSIHVPGLVNSMLVDPGGKMLYVGTITDGLHVIDRESLA